MQKYVNRTTHTLSVAAALIALFGYLLMPAQYGRFSTSAKLIRSSSGHSLPTLQGEGALEQLKQRGLYTSLQEAIAATRYEVRWEDRPALGGLSSAYHAPNPAQRLSTYFTPADIHLAPLQSSGESQPGHQALAGAEWRATMKFAGYGYGDKLQPLAGLAELLAEGERIEYRRAGASLTEWYVNSAAGLEQGFTIDARPATRSEGENLRLALELSGDLQAELVEEGRAIALKRTNGEPALRYGNLYAYDAKGQPLPSRMSVSRRQVILEVDDANALYPVTIDPLITLQQKLTAYDGAHQDYFGWAVAIAGDTAVVGAHSADIGSNVNQGAAYVFVRNGTTWSLETKLTAGAAYESFGQSVAISGSTIAVGASGSVYVFVRAYAINYGPFWYQQQTLTGTGFGWSVAISGNTLVLGVPITNSYRGSAHVFVRSNSTWTQQQEITASDGAADDHFGNSVAISGDTVIVGANQDNLNFQDQGSAYVFVRSGNTWSQQQKLFANDGATFDGFGRSVAINGDTAVMGSPGDGNGSVHVFVRNGNTWSPQPKLTAADGAADDGFGISLAMTADTLVVGSFRDDVDSYNQGSAYVFVGGGSSWNQQQKLVGDGGAQEFGLSVAVSGDTVIVGDHLNNSIKGAAYVFATWGQQQKLTTGAADDHFGYSVAISGNRAVVGAPFHDINSLMDRGAVYVFVRNGSIWTQEQKLTAYDGASYDLFGQSVAIDGDTLVVGAPQDDWYFENDRGSAYVFVRSGSSWSKQDKLLASDADAGDYFGRSVAISGDTVVVAAPGDNVGSNNGQGSAYVFVRSSLSWSLQQQLIAANGMAYDDFGRSVGVSGDTVVVGVPKHDVGSSTNQGTAFVFVRSGQTWSQQQQLTAADGAAYDDFGRSVAISGETLVVGAYVDHISNHADQGSAYVFVRSASVWSQQQHLVANDGAANDWFGFSVAISGDTIVVGAPGDSIGSSSARGSAYVFVRSNQTWSQHQKLTANDGAALDWFGFSVATSGGTAAIGAYGDKVGSDNDQGSVYIFARQ